ncbi:phospholipase D-like domain-containing protein [Propionivibrio sp.]|uniref:phospholipase D-like domain-containing protein n=1 Tax=Propionivibrio sp. TaxID=2212460 RepID=UPI003BF173FD
MRIVLLVILSSILLLPSCGGGDSNPGLSSLIIQPDDGRDPILKTIAKATDNIRLAIYEITDLQSVTQTPAAPADSVVQALIDKARSGVSVRIIVDQNQYSTGSSALLIEQTVAALRAAGAIVHLSSTAFCVTHQKTLVIDGPTTANPGLSGTAIIMSLNLMPGYFGGTRDYAVITSETGIVKEVSSVFDSDFVLVNPHSACYYAHSPGDTYYPPGASDTPSVSEGNLLWSPVNSKPKLLQLMGSATKSLEITTEELTDTDMVCKIEAIANSAAKPNIRILLSGDTGSNAPAVTKLLGLDLPNLSIRIMPGQPTPPATTPVTPLYMHGKQIIADGTQAFVGSENLTNTSLLQNRELGILFTDPEMIARLYAVFISDFSASGNSLPAQTCTLNCGTPINCP